MGEGADAPTASHATSSQIHPHLRQRMLNRAATISEGASPMQPLSRRRSSILSDYSDTRYSSYIPGGNDMEGLTSSDEPSLWYSAPLAFAILPAIGGLFFTNGSAYVTDLLLLGFGAMFLNWCVRAPWDWYHAAQQRQYVSLDDESSDGTIVEENEGSEGTRAKDPMTPPDSAGKEAPAEEIETNASAQSEAQKAAGRQLAKEELSALAACFLGPMLGAYILHAVRSQLTRPAEGLVSNYNLTIFIMAAELRPVSHLIKMKQARVLHLQRVVRSDGRDKLGQADAQELSRRLDEVEARLALPVTGGTAETTRLSATIHQSLQPQLDALNRAVRRYEKRQVAQSMQLEARFADLEARLKDALALAAAAVRTGQRPGTVSMMWTWYVHIIRDAVRTGLALVTYPLRLAASVSGVQSWFAKAKQQPRKRYKGESDIHTSIPASRLQSRIAK